MNSETRKETDLSEVFIIPSTHWDREWYLPYQEFRFALVKMIDQLLDILLRENYYFMFDGQTIILEDYFEIRPEKKEFLLNFIRNRRIEVGPWYLLPDEWLVGQESLLRNLETSIDLAREYEIPLMQIAYLPDQFGHSRAIPQIIADLTSFETAMVWRGVGPEIVTVPFRWKSNYASTSSILGVYMPYGYGNAASLPENLEDLTEAVKENINELLQYSPVPVFQLMNGTDHQQPNSKIIPLIEQLRIDNTSVEIGLLNHFVERLKSSINEKNHVLPEFSGEFRSSARAPLLQDTYSARMWIKQWNQKMEDLLVHYAEPLNSYLWFYLNFDYPAIYLNLAWKWLLKNHPHDSICGCSIDQTHEEMKARFFWSETISKTIIKNAISDIDELSNKEEKDSILVFNPTNNTKEVQYFEYEVPSKTMFNSLMDEAGGSYEIQPISSAEDIIFEDTLSPFMLRAGLKMLPGRKLIDDYLNEVSIFDSDVKDTCEIRIICDKKPIGEFDVKKLKNDAIALVNSKKYKRFHVKATRGTNLRYASLAHLNSWCFKKFALSTELPKSSKIKSFKTNKRRIENEFYKVKFNLNGTFDLKDKKLETVYKQQHLFEDWGDRGDEYTFGRVGPEYAKVMRVKRRIINKGPLFCDIEQKIRLRIFKKLHSTREKRKGKRCLKIKTNFRFYRDTPRIDIKTSFTNNSEDHRLRICFDLPFESLETLTSTHFGCIRRRSGPFGDDTYIESPSGIQPQKRYIRIEDNLTDKAITLTNKGLPEVELVRNSRLALTLLRCIGFLSRSDFKERPLHAGPFLETPGAQELGVNYEYEYSFMTHSKTEKVFQSDNHSEIASLIPKTILVSSNEINQQITKPLIELGNPWIRISSLRARDGKLRITLFNLNEKTEICDVKLDEKISKITHIRIDDSIKDSFKVTKGAAYLEFSPLEIKMFILE